MQQQLQVIRQQLGTMTPGYLRATQGQPGAAEAGLRPEVLAPHRWLWASR